MFNEKLRASIAKPAIPKMAMTTFPARERKLSSRIIFLTIFFKVEALYVSFRIELKLEYVFYFCS